MLITTGTVCVDLNRVRAGMAETLDRLGVDGGRFIADAEHILTASGSAVGAPQSLTDLCAHRQTKYLRGMQAPPQLFLAKQVA